MNKKCDWCGSTNTERRNPGNTPDDIWQDFCHDCNQPFDSNLP